MHRYLIPIQPKIPFSPKKRTLTHQHPIPCKSIPPTKNKIIIYSNSHNFCFFSLMFISCKETPGLCNHNMYIDCQAITVKIGTDKTVWLVITSVSGNDYLFIIFDLDSNFILEELMPSRTKQSIKNIYADIIKIPKNRGLKPKLLVLDNKAL